MECLKTHVKIVKWDVAYYINTALFETQEFNLINEETSTLKLMEASVIAINLTDNKIIKCRYLLVDLVDAVL